jgi:hypothetical protein
MATMPDFVASLEPLIKPSHSYRLHPPRYIDCL